MRGFSELVHGSRGSRAGQCPVSGMGGDGVGEGGREEWLAGVREVAVRRKSFKCTIGNGRVDGGRWNSAGPL